MGYTYHKDLTGADLHAPKFLNGAGSPVGVTVPSYIGQIYFDTDNDIPYIANGTSTNADWQMISNPYRILSIPISNPTSSDNFLVYRFRNASTIKNINAVCMDGTSITFKLNECDANGGSASQICNSCTATTSNTAATITNAGVDAGDYISYTSSAVSGAVTKAIIVVEYIEVV